MRSARNRDSARHSPEGINPARGRAARRTHADTCIRRGLRPRRPGSRVASPRVPVDGRAGVLGTDRCPTAIYLPTIGGPREIPAPLWCRRRRAAAACGLPTWAAYARSRCACMCHVAADLPPRRSIWRLAEAVRWSAAAARRFPRLFACSRCPHRASLSLSPGRRRRGRGGIFLLAFRHLVRPEGEKRRLSGRNTNPPCLFLSPVCHLFLGW